MDPESAAISTHFRGYPVGLRRLVLLSAAASLAAVLAPVATAGRAAPRTEFLLTLKAPSLATAISQSRVLSAGTKRARLDLRAPTNMSYLRGLASVQRNVQRSITTTLPDTSVRWHYQVVLDGISVVAPPQDAGRLGRLPAVAHVYPALRYHPLEQLGYQVVGAPELWGPSLTTAGQGVKIGVIDDGVDQTHPYLGATGFSMPPGFPKGNRRYTNAKVIVARAFAPPHPKWRYAHLPFDPKLSEHGTHVAGIAAGDYNTNADGTSISGVAPKAYIGNYKVLSIPTESGVGPDGNAPEIVAAIEAAVRVMYSTRQRSFGSAGAGLLASRSSAHRNAASVLPDPVGAITRVFSPPSIDDHAPACAGVGSVNAPVNHSRVSALNPARASLPA